MRLLIAILLCAPLATPAALPDLTTAVNKIGQRCAAAKQYSFEGEMQLAGQRGAAPGKVLSQAKVKFALAPDGKYFLRIEPAGKDAYVLVSNGQKSWAYVPKLKQYSEEESAASDDSGDEEEGASDSEHDLAENFARQIMPTLARLHTSARGANFGDEVAVRYQGKKQKWPMLRVFGKVEKDGGRSLTQLAINPETLDIGRMIFANVTYEKDVKVVIQLTFDFTSLETGDVPASTFDFEPPKGVKLVDAVPIPGQTGSALLNQTAPDFELKTLDGEKIHLSELRGQPVLLSFWASWCPPCRRELPELVKLNAEYGAKGLRVFGVNDEGKGAAHKYAEKAGLTFATLDDSSLKAHHLYRIRSIPTVFLIDKNGKVVRFLRGGKDPATLRAALASVGL